MDFEVARFNMIQQQIRPWGVADPGVLALMHTIPREAFVSSSQQTLAFADLNLPIGYGEEMWQPKVEARVLQALAPKPNDRVLEIGTGSGHLTALLASCSSHVASVEIKGEFVDPARDRLMGQNISNVELIEGDGSRGWDSPEKWDVIVLTGSLPTLPPCYQDIMAPGGRMAAIVGLEPVMEALLYLRHDDESWSSRSLFDTTTPPLINAAQPDPFVF